MLVWGDATGCTFWGCMSGAGSLGEEASSGSGSSNSISEDDAGGSDTKDGGAIGLPPGVRVPEPLPPIPPSPLRCLSGFWTPSRMDTVAIPSLRWLFFSFSAFSNELSFSVFIRDEVSESVSSNTSSW